MDELDRYNGRPVDVPKWLQNSFGSQDDRFTIDALRGARASNAGVLDVDEDDGDSDVGVGVRVPARPRQTGVYTMSRLHALVNPGHVENQARIAQLMRRDANPYESMETRLHAKEQQAARTDKLDPATMQQLQHAARRAVDPPSVQPGTKRECFVCNTSITSRAEEKQLPCGHSLHFSCAGPWVAGELKRVGAHGGVFCGVCQAPIGSVPGSAPLRKQAECRQAPPVGAIVEPVPLEEHNRVRPPKRDKPKRHSTLAKLAAVAM